jgi:hypothetical protein
VIFKHSLLDEFDVRGDWRLPGTDRSVPGEVRYSPKHGIRLSLDRPLESGLAGIKSLLQPKMALYDVVQGRGLDGNDFTLFGLDNRGFGAISCRLMAVGENVATESELSYKAVAVELEGLEAFSGAAPISSRVDEDSQTVVYRQLEPFSVKLDETYDLSIEHRPAWAVSFGKHSLEHRASVRVQAVHERPIAEYFAGPTAAFQRLVELAAGRRVRIRSVRAESSRSLRPGVGRQIRDHSLLFFRQTVPGPDLDNPYPSDLLFNISSLGDRASSAIQNWNTRYSHTWPVLSFYFMLDPRFDLDAGLELHFINALSAIEHLHRVNSGRKRGKTTALDMQLSQLIDAMPHRFGFLFEPQDEFIAGVVATRSHLLHGQIRGKQTLQGKPLWMTVNALRLIIQLGLFKQMALDEPLLIDILGRTREVRLLDSYKRAPHPT